MCRRQAWTRHGLTLNAKAWLSLVILTVVIMYASASRYLAGTPLALGSWWGLIGFAAILPFLTWRLIDEERMLARELPGYPEYQKRVRYRLVPHLW